MGACGYVWLCVSGTERLINELIKYNKPFQMLAYPNRSHGIFEGEGTVRHLFEVRKTRREDRTDQEREG